MIVARLPLHKYGRQGIEDATARAKISEVRRLVMRDLEPGGWTVVHEDYAGTTYLEMGMEAGANSFEDEARILQVEKARTAAWTYLRGLFVPVAGKISSSPIDENPQENFSRASLPRDAGYDFAGAWFRRSSLQGKVLRVHFSEARDRGDLTRRMEVDLILGGNSAMGFSGKGFPSGEITVVMNTDETWGESSLVIEPSIQFPLWYSQELLRVLYRWLRDDRGYRIVVHNVYKKAQIFSIRSWVFGTATARPARYGIWRLTGSLMRSGEKYVIHLDRLNEKLYQPLMPDSGDLSSSSVQEGKSEQYLSLVRQRLMRRMPGRTFIVFDEETGALSGDRHVNVFEEGSSYPIAQIAFRMERRQRDRLLTITSQFVMKTSDENYRRQGIATAIVSYLITLYQPDILLMSRVNEKGLAFMRGLARNGLVDHVSVIETRQYDKDVLAYVDRVRAQALLGDNDTEPPVP